VACFFLYLIVCGRSTLRGERYNDIIKYTLTQGDHVARKQNEFTIVVDTETSGLTHDPRARLLELAFVVINDQHEFVDAAQMFVNPSVWTPNWGAAFKIHGYNPAYIQEHGKTEADAFKLLSEYEEKYNQPRWTSFNKRFDLEMLSRIDFTPRSEAECIMSLSAAAMKLNKRAVAMQAAINTLLPDFCYDVKKAHKAGYDAFAAASLYTHIQKKHLA